MIQRGEMESYEEFRQRRENNLRTVVAILKEDTDIYQIVSALRGPDGEDADGILKDLTTARIRATIGFNDKDCGMIVTDKPLSDERKEERDRVLSHTSWHFRCHYNNAVEGITRILKYDLWREKKE